MTKIPNFVFPSVTPPNINLTLSVECWVWMAPLSQFWNFQFPFSTFHSKVRAAKVHGKSCKLKRMLRSIESSVKKSILMSSRSI